jgi:hypothetical protein
VDNPIVVPSLLPERIIGVTDPEDDTLVIWGIVREGEPPKQVRGGAGGARACRVGGGVEGRAGRGVLPAFDGRQRRAGGCSGRGGQRRQGSCAQQHKRQRREGGSSSAGLTPLTRLPLSFAPQLVAGGEFFTLQKVERIEKVSDKLGIPDPALSS